MIDDPSRPLGHKIASGGRIWRLLEGNESIIFSRYGYCVEGSTRFHEKD